MVRGYEIEKVGSNFIDVEKPRTIKKLDNQVFAFDRVSKIKVNRVFGAPFVGMGVNHVVSFKKSKNTCYSCGCSWYRNRSCKSI